MIAKTKASVSLSHSLLTEIAPYTENGNTSQFIEKALMYYLAELKRQTRKRRDLEIINTHAARFSREVVENLEFQDMP
jgi:metal-responsive CopG/Arc/MetJ family transcriptional regulator